MVCLFLAGLGGGGFFSVATAQQPSVSLNLLDKSGHPIGNKEGAVQVKITGDVLDAETGRRLPLFHLNTGAQSRDHRSFDWSDKGSVTCSNGAFNVTVAKERMRPAVLIEAEGYLPQCSGPLRGQETNLTFRLKKGAGPSGVVLTPDGSPAAGRTVYLSRLKDLVYLDGTNLTPRKISPRVSSTMTDQAGHFSFAPDLEAFGVLVADQAGFAEVRLADLQASPQVRLQPWARVEGTLKIGTQPASNETVRLGDAFAKFAYYPRPLPTYSINTAVTTDAQGRFVFPRVPPADVKISQAPKVGRAGWEEIPITQITNLTLKPGETRTIILGGQGRQIVGRIHLKNYHKDVDWKDQLDWIDSLAPEPPECPTFGNILNEFHAARSAARTPEESDAAENLYLAKYDRIARQISAYYASPAGRQYWFSRRNYILRFAPDGSFHIDDVPGGKYELTLDLRSFEANLSHARSPRIALRRQEIDVPDSPGGHSDTPLDLGVIEILAQLNPGDLVPDFAVKTLDDKQVKLSDYLGKYVLVDFWASTNGPSLAAMPDLRETYDAYKNNPRFAMLGLNLDEDAATAKASTVNQKMEWPQGLLGKWTNCAVADQFGVESLPFIMLVDPNGRVFAPGLEGGRIKAAVDATLGGD